MKREIAELRLSGDKPCSASGDCDTYILALEADLAAIKAARDEMYLWPPEHDEWGAWDERAVQKLLDAIDRAGPPKEEVLS